MVVDLGNLNAMGIIGSWGGRGQQRQGGHGSQNRHRAKAAFGIVQLLQTMILVFLEVKYLESLLNSFFLFCFVFCFLFVVFLGPNSRHMEVPRLGVELEL